jgi:hypothetical protein
MQQTLCSHCELLNTMPTLLTGSDAIPATGKSMIFIGKRSQRIECDMCRFFLNISPGYRKDYKLHVRLYDHRNGLSLRSVPRTPFLSVIRQNKKLRYDFSVKEEVTQNGIVVYRPTDSSESDPMPVHSVDAEIVDFTLLSSFIRRCQDSHTLCNQVESRYNLPYIYLINCIEKKVVREHPS